MLVYYFVEVSLITFIVTLFASFIVVKFVIALAFFQQKKKKNVIQNKKNRFLLYKNYDIKP